jgi:ubiquitin-protein ligase E3 C
MDLLIRHHLTVLDAGQTELVPNGSCVTVTNVNRLQYVYLVAHHKLNVQIQKQCAAFFRGLSDLIAPHWLRLFNVHELQSLIGGASVSLDMDDLQVHCSYAGDFHEEHPSIRMFWHVVLSFEEQDKRALVRFVTSCSRPPLLGFKQLRPSFTIRSSGNDESRLRNHRPFLVRLYILYSLLCSATSSTCVNLLKMPVYTNAETLRT